MSCPLAETREFPALCVRAGAAAVRSRNSDFQSSTVGRRRQ